jgi:hypothetical protein
MDKPTGRTMLDNVSGDDVLDIAVNIAAFFVLGTRAMDMGPPFGSGDSDGICAFPDEKPAGRVMPRPFLGHEYGIRPLCPGNGIEAFENRRFDGVFHFIGSQVSNDRNVLKRRRDFGEVGATGCQNK